MGCGASPPCNHSTSSHPVSASMTMTPRAGGPSIHHCSGPSSASGSTTPSPSTIPTFAAATSARPAISSVIRKIQFDRGSSGTDNARRIAGIARKIIVIGAPSSARSSGDRPDVRSGSFHPSTLSRPFSTKPPAAASNPTTSPWCSTLRRIVIHTNRRTACRTGARPIHRFERPAPRITRASRASRASRAC